MWGRKKRDERALLELWTIIESVNDHFGNRMLAVQEARHRRDSITRTNEEIEQQARTFSEAPKRQPIEFVAPKEIDDAHYVVNLDALYVAQQKLNSLRARETKVSPRIDSAMMHFDAYLNGLLSVAPEWTNDNISRYRPLNVLGLTCEANARTYLGSGGVNRCLSAMVGAEAETRQLRRDSEGEKGVDKRSLDALSKAYDERNFVCNRCPFIAHGEQYKPGPVKRFFSK